MEFQITNSDLSVNFPVRVFNTETMRFSEDSQQQQQPNTRNSILSNNHSLILEQENFSLEQNGYYLIYYPITGSYHVTQLNMTFINVFTNVTSSFCSFGEYLIQIVGRITF